MKLVELTDGVVTDVTDLGTNLEYELSEDTDLVRVGSKKMAGRFVAATHAVEVDETSGLVVAVARNSWADEQPPRDGFT